MPCDASHMESNHSEVEASKIMCLLEELETGEQVDPESSSWKGYHPRVYCKSFDLHGLTSRLCNQLQKIKKKDIKKYSLEMQVWWRDHQRADKERIERELEVHKNQKAKERALKKLTPYERELLGH